MHIEYLAKSLVPSKYSIIIIIIFYKVFGFRSHDAITVTKNAGQIPGTPESLNDM